MHCQHGVLKMIIMCLIFIISDVQKGRRNSLNFRLIHSEILKVVDLKAFWKFWSKSRGSCRSFWGTFLSSLVNPDGISDSYYWLKLLRLIAKHLVL